MPADPVPEDLTADPRITLLGPQRNPRIGQVVADLGLAGLGPAWRWPGGAEEPDGAGDVVDQLAAAARRRQRQHEAAVHADTQLEQHAAVAFVSGRAGTGVAEAW